LVVLPGTSVQRDSVAGVRVDPGVHDDADAEVAVADLIAWPSLVTQPHRSAPVTRGVKYGLTIWVRLPG
jgi:predicted 2-oxoglutarate/Fe(II)-dependent dioxygenase YbiX